MFNKKFWEELIAYFDTAWTAQKMMRPTFLLLLHMYSLPRERFYVAVALQKIGGYTYRHTD
jgi:hypothetical protein